MISRHGWLAVASAIAFAAFAPSAAGAAAGNLGPGGRPGLAVDAQGTAYVSWIGAEPSVTSLHFCRLPRGATTCQALTLPATGTSISRPFVSIDGQVVRVLSYRYGREAPSSYSAVELFTSTDGGQKFGPPSDVGTVAFSDAVAGPGGGVSLATDAVSEGEQYQRVPTDGSAAATSNATLSTTHPYVGTVGLVDDASPLAVFADGSGNGQFRVCNACAGAKDPNDVANWSPPQDIGIAESGHLAGGRNGLFLMSSNALTGGHLVVRKYGGGSFGPSVPVPNGTGETPQSYLTQDPGGRLHALWPRIDADAIHLYYATSDDGARWTQGTLFAASEAFGGVRAAAAPDHIGLAVWEAGTGQNSQVHFLPMGPVPPTSVYTGPTRPVRISDQQASYTMVVPRGCVSPGQRFRVTLTWKRKKRKGNLFVKVRRSDFYLAAKVVKRDQRAPFVYTYRVLVTQRPGSTITVRARAFIKVRHGRPPKKSIRARIKVCG